MDTKLLKFIEKAKIVHENKYDYSLAEYKDSITKIKIICPEHGIFEQNPNGHLSGCGCYICGGTKKLTTKEFIKKATEVHGNKYDYSLVDYKNNETKVKIICRKHGIFEQTPAAHYRVKCGCPLCKISKGENKIVKFLIENNIDFERQKTFLECTNINLLPFDFYILKHNLCIEYDGEQHFKPIDIFGGKTAFEELKKRDEIKTNYCIKNNIKLLRIKYNENIENILKENLIEC